MRKPIIEMVMVFKKTPTMRELIAFMDSLRAFMESNPNILGIEKIVICFREEE